MVNHEFFVREIPCNNASEIFSKIYYESIAGTDLCPYRLSHLMKGDNQNAYAFFERDYSIVPVAFYIDDELQTFMHGDVTTMMSLDEIKLLMELGIMNLDGIAYEITGTAFNLVDELCGCQRIFVFYLEELKEEEEK